MSWTISGKSVLVTGGNSGIGFETCVELANRGARVTFTARNMAKGEQALQRMRAAGAADVELMELDLSSFASIRSFAGLYLESHPELHVLINNAGLMQSERKLTEDGLEMTLGVNHVGTFLLTDLLLERIKASAPARIINLASDAHHRALGGIDFDDLMGEQRFDGWLTYCRSKLANIYFTDELARRLEGTGITVNSVHPGVVKTGFAQDGDAAGLWNVIIKVARPFMIDARKGAQTTVFLATDDEVGSTTGEYFAKSRIAKKSKHARNRQAAERLWAATTDIVEAAQS